MAGMLLCFCCAPNKCRTDTTCDDKRYHDIACEDYERIDWNWFGDDYRRVEVGLLRLRRKGESKND